MNKNEKKLSIPDCELWRQETTKTIQDVQVSLISFMADMLLSIPMGITYEEWVFLHQIKGDYND